MVDQHRNLQRSKDSCPGNDDQEWQLGRGIGIVSERGRIELRQQFQQQLGHNEQKGIGDDRIKGILKKGLKPAPKQKIKFGQNEEWNEDRTDQRQYANGDIAESDYRKNHQFQERKHNQDDGGGQVSRNAEAQKEFPGSSGMNETVNLHVQGDLGLATDLVGQVKGLVGYEVGEADAYAGNR